MNFLAHALLAGSDPGILTGSLIADYIKGPAKSRFPPAVRQGISHHRRVDAYTDRHPVVLGSIRRIRNLTRHYSGVVIDVLYDHFLARDFDRHSGMSLGEFVDGVEAAFFEIRRAMPELIEPRWNTTRWLAGYATLDGIERSFDRIAQRTRGRFNPDPALEALAANDAALEQDFRRFFPDLQRYAAAELVSLSTAAEMD